MSVRHRLAWRACAALLCSASVADANEAATLAPQRAPPPAASSEATPRNVAILVLSAEQVGVRSFDVYASTREAIEEHTVLEVAPLDVFSDSMRAQTIRLCAGDGRCFANKLAASGVHVDLLLTVSADRLGESVLLGMRLVDTRRARRGDAPDLATVGEGLPAGVSLLRAIRDQLPRVFGESIWGQIASLVVEADRPNAEVLVGEITCVSPCKLGRMRPGRYEVIVRKPGFVPWTASVLLEAGQVERRAVELRPEERSIFVSPWLWVAVAAGAAAASTAVYFAVRPADGPSEVCIAVREELCR